MTTSTRQIIGGRFEIANPEQDLLGRGGMGDVYRGRDLETGKVVSIKALRPEVVASDPNALARFRREGEALRKLDHHNIVKLIDAVQDGGRHYLVMEYVPGGSLQELLDEPRRSGIAMPGLPIERTVQIALEIADALTRAHHLGILHRDLKPSNVLLAEDGTPRLTDFGHAHLETGPRLTETGTVVGTLLYLSPEACRGETLDARADIWSFGAMLYEMLAGEPPFPGQTFPAVLMAILSQPVPDLSRVRPEVPDALADLVYRMLEKDRMARIPSVRLVGAELEAVAKSYKDDQRLMKAEGRQVERARQPQAAESRFATPTPLAAGTSRQPQVAHNLPAQLIPFVGREETLAEIEERLRDPGCRLLTLVGLGGSGKTRLALEVAARQVDRFAHGAWFVPLTPLQSVEAIVPTVAQTLDFTFSAGSEPKEQLLGYLRQKNLLLVLDSYEHLLEGVGVIADILRAAPEVVILVTSRSALNVQGESLYPVSGMSYPAPRPTEDSRTPSPGHGRGVLAEEAVQYGAVRLFMDSARRAQPDFELTDDNLADVVRICHLVAGMPLAILLAAAWLRVLAPAEIADQIAGGVPGETGEGLDFLASDQRDVPERQRSMRAVFDYSWRLLSERERAVMQALSVFRGGCTREAAKEVAGVSLRDLMSLADRSLLYRTSAPSAARADAWAFRTGGRFEIHELLRQYAAEQLDRSPSAYQAARDGHCAYYAAALARWAADWKGPRQRMALAEMEDEIENARAAWEWAVERVSERAVEWLGQAMEGLGLFYDWRVRCEEGEAAFRAAAGRLAEMEQEAARRVWIKALTWQASFSYPLGRAEIARQLLQQSLDLLEGPEFADQDVRPEKAFVLQEMGLVESSFGNRERARQLVAQSVSLYRALGDRWATANALWELATLLQAIGEFDQARRLHQEALDIRRALGDQGGIVQSLAEIGQAFANQGQFQEAERSIRESVTIGRELSDRIYYVWGLFRLGLVLAWKGEFAESLPVWEEFLAIESDLGASSGVASVHSFISSVKAHLGHFDQARVYLQRGLALAREVGHRWGLGMALFHLGHLALAEEQYADAQGFLEESVAVLQELGQRSDVGGPLALLAGAARGLGQLPEARERLCEALQISVAIRDVVTPLYALPIAALLVSSLHPADRGKMEQAVEIYALASRYGFVANSRLWEDIAGRRMAALAATLPPEVVAAAQERGRARDLQATVEELLGELNEDRIGPNRAGQFQPAGHR